MVRKRAPHPDEQPTLLEAAQARGALTGPPAPLADRMRPQTLQEVVGQGHLLGAGHFLSEVIAGDRVPSIILWGPPGSGKTTLAHVISRATRSEFVAFSAVLGGVAELRTVVAAARERRSFQGRRTILFVDEIHRFNRSQQDAFLPHVENGTITLIGATTENPSFAVNAAVLSRCKVLRLEPLVPEALEELVSRALEDPRKGLGALGLELPVRARSAIVAAARGDARRALNLLESCAELAVRQERREIDLDLVEQASQERTLLYDKAGEEHYNVVSALIKSLRGSDPDAAVYWLMRMLEAGDDPLFVLRRMIIFASEDVGNADPRALTVAVNADAAFRRVGMPEGLYPITQACLYLACCPKSNSVGQAFAAAKELIRRHGALPVPKKLRNAPTVLMRDEGYGEGYRYPHDEAGHFAPGETYLPEELIGTNLYSPSDQGLEHSIRERLSRLRSRREP